MGLMAREKERIELGSAFSHHARQLPGLHRRMDWEEASQDNDKAMTEDLLKDCGEEELIRQICAGQTELFCALIAPYQRPVYAIAYSVVNNAADAEEVAQEAFLNALKSLSNFRAESKF